MSVKQISAEEFDRLFDEGADINDYIDFDSARFPAKSQQPELVKIEPHLRKKLNVMAKRTGMSVDLLVQEFIHAGIKLKGLSTNQSPLNPSQITEDERQRDHELVE